MVVAVRYDDGKGVLEGGNSGGGACRLGQKRRHVRPVPKPPHVPDHRHPGQHHRLRRARDGRFDAQILEFPGDADFQQTKKSSLKKLDLNKYF